jgi:transposase
MNTPLTASPQTGWIGIDVAKASFDAALCAPGTTVHSFTSVPVQTFPRTLTGIQQLIAWAQRTAPGLPLRAVMEATGRYSLELSMWLLQARPDWSPAIIQPKLSRYFLQSLGLRNKTDRLDARGLAYYGVERTPAAYAPPQPEYAELRELVRYRRTLVAQQTAEKNQMSEGAQTKHVLQCRKRRLTQLASDIQKTEAALRQCMAKHPALSRDLKLLMTIDGVGFIVAATLMAELGDLRRFAQGRQLAAFVGLSPRNIDSGDSVHRPAHLHKGGNAHARQILFLAGMAAIRKVNSFRQMYDRLLLKHPDHPIIALAAIMRKILLVARAILIAGEAYNAHYIACGKKALV